MILAETWVWRVGEFVTFLRHKSHHNLFIHSFRVLFRFDGCSGFFLAFQVFFCFRLPPDIPQYTLALFSCYKTAITNPQMLSGHGAWLGHCCPLALMG